ncbi:GIY-YIG nuclease family protein [Chryseobacterium daecheongense]|uniref:GIY-YIG nuclease family protein n=1 Tax=Chryseobacterium daecheongense TaxID=192389 RepID=UPI001FD716C1|nr:GIY-YIG nuclease family protein [Chryseobacterium daecheongense]UOU98002.1 GIY-YIG nuclease family protein [Chryseobacterium daecheongense]
MKTLGTHNYYVYILTNINKTVLYTGVTNDLKSRLYWHKNTKGENNHFTAKYKCFYLVYYEYFQDVEQSIAREKQIKGYSRLKKENLINTFNSDWSFLNEIIE